MKKASGGACALLFAATCAAGAAEPYSWLPQPRALELSDREDSFQVICHGSHDTCDAGVRFAKPERIDELEVSFAVVAARAYEPALAGQALEYWSGDRWLRAPVLLTVDYRGAGAAAAVQGSGVSRWRYRFAPVETTRVRVLLLEPRNRDVWHRAYALHSLGARLAGGKFEGTGVRTIGSLPDAPGWLEAGLNLAVAASGAQVMPGISATVRWPKRMLVSRLEWEPAVPAAAEWWDGAIWRPLEMAAPAEAGRLRFLPVSTTAMRIRNPKVAIRSMRAQLDANATEYAREVEQSRFDLIGRRFRGMATPDLNAMRGLLLPLTFAQTAIGRPADAEETHVTWNGTFFVVEEGGGRDWNHGAPNRGPRSERHDRWFAFAAGDPPEAPGGDSSNVSTTYLDGWLPATVSRWRKDGMEYAQTLFVTAPEDPIYATAAELRITNLRPEPGTARVRLAMGRRRNAQTPGPQRTPLAFWPERTGYRAVNGRTIVSSGGNIVAVADTPGQWGGSERENHLTYALELGPGQSRSLRFLMPSVTEPMAAAAVPNFDWAESLSGFRDYWTGTLEAGAAFEFPELELNRIYRNLLAQCFIITLDGDEVKYGSYSYESYFGIEEGWPAIALAQYGHFAAAQRVLSAMLSPQLMDKSNYHHQYRNGLEPWYAVTAYRLSRNRAWLEGIAPALESAAEWTIRAIHENGDSRYGGVLPRHAYGGDIHTPAYSFYSNATCWRGLHDTALAFRALGRTEAAARYEREAAAYHDRLTNLADSLAERTGGLVFLPMSFDIGDGAEHRDKEPAYDFLATTHPPSYTWGYLGNFWNLFAPMLLEVKLFEASDRRSHWVPEYMDARGGVLAGLARFTIGLDQIYGKGYYESLLEQGRRADFATSLYGVLAHGMSENLYSFPEVAGVFPLRFDNRALWQEHARTMWDWGFPGAEQSEGQPLSAGPGMALQLLRMAVVRETVESARQDTLRLFDGAPAHWFEPGKRIRISRAPTLFGTISADTVAARDAIVAHVTTAPDFDAREIVVRLEAPASRPLRAVSVNGRAWTGFAGHEIRLPGKGQYEIRAEF